MARSRQAWVSRGGCRSSAPQASQHPATSPATCASRSDRKSTRLNSSHSQISYAVFCLKKKKHDEKIAVYDLGGGTFDLSLLELGAGVFEVTAPNGATRLAGDDYAQRVIEWQLATCTTT